MLGNDIVDLGDEETREEDLHPRFDQRVFTTHESAVLSAAEDRHRLRWSVWAAKESAFKAAKRENPDAIFAHRSFEVMLEPDGWGTVRRGLNRWIVCASQYGDAVHVVCAQSREDHQQIVAAAAEKAPQADPSETVRRLARRELARHLAVTESELRISSSSDRIPRLEINGERAPGLLSLSHHGRFVAFAFLPKR